jgi:hypothetical protein
MKPETLRIDISWAIYFNHKDIPGARKYTGSRPEAIATRFWVTALCCIDAGRPKISSAPQRSIPLVNKLSRRTVKNVRFQTCHKFHFKLSNLRIWNSLILP